MPKKENTLYREVWEQKQKKKRRRNQEKEGKKNIKKE